MCVCVCVFVCRGDWSLDRPQETRQRERFYVLSDDITHLGALKHALPAHNPQKTHPVKSQMMSEQIKRQHASFRVPYFGLCMTKREGEGKRKEVQRGGKERERVLFSFHDLVKFALPSLYLQPVCHIFKYIVTFHPSFW